jgi:hypothetical protein
MKKIIFILFSWIAAFSFTKLQAQIFTISPGTNVTIKPGTVFFADSLTLIPSADFTLCNVSLGRNTTVSHAIPNPYIVRVYQFSNITNPFYGTIQINYQDGAELKNLPESELKLNIYNGTTWNSYAPATRDAVNNYVLTTGINGVTLNELTLAADCPPPTIQCNTDTVVNATTGKCGAVVNYKTPVVTDICGIASVIQIAGLQSGAMFPVGTTANTFVATGSSGKTDTCSFKVTVHDIEAPVITQVSANPSLLWPPNHKMKNVTINYQTWDNCGTVSSTLAVSSNEPVAGTGGGDQFPDWVILDNHHLQLRAERSGGGNDRVYTITITSTDASGNSAIEKTKVVVPDNKKGSHDENEYTFDCKVMPNPSRQYFSIQITSTSGEKVEANLFDVNGQLISKLNTVKNQTLRFGDNLKPGVYIVEIRQGEQRKTISVIKQ